MIKLIIISMLNIIMILPVYAALSVNPINLPVSNLESGTYILEFDTLTTEHSIKYCLDITIAQNFYYEIVLDGGITWGRDIDLTAIENAVLVSGGVKDDNIATFFIQNNSELILLGTCLNLDTELVVNVPPAPLSTKFTITTTIKEPTLGINLNPPQTENLIILTTSCDNITEIPQAECETLVELYNNTYGNNWTDSDNWNLTNTPCSWNGVSCINEHVIAIERPAKNLTGSLPDLSALTELQTLDLKGNKLVGYIPSMNSLTKLQVLILSGGNQIIGRIPKLDTLVDLQWIDLANNQLTGNIPDLENLNSLRHLNLANNQLEGSIPTSLKNLNNLELLKLNNNKINANIPDLSNLIKLQTIWLQNNQLEASIPPIDSLINLTDLDLGYNKLITDATSQEFITSKDSDWDDTQTIFPTNIIATAKSTTSIEINWTAINYIADAGFYQINYSTTSGDYNTAINTNSKTDTSLTIDDLSPATTYYFTITTVTRPHGQQQNELNSTSGEFTVTTLPKITNVVPKITVVDIDANTIVDGDRIIFENVILNSEFSKTFAVINNSDTSVNLSQLEIIGDDIFKIKEYFEPIIVTIDKNESTTFSISLDTSETGVFTGEILFHFSHEDNPYNFFITSEIIIDEVDVTLPNIFSTPEPDSLLDMGSSELGTPSTTTEITILQSGIEIIDISITADEINDYTVINELNILTVQCIPSEIGTREGILKISYLVAEQIETAQYFLTCIGESTLNYISDPEPNSTLTMSSIIATPTATSIEISNTGNSTLAITEIIVTNNEVFQIDNTPFLVNDEVHLLRVQCIPVQEGKYSVTLTLITNLPKPITYELECIGIRNIIEPIYNSIPKPDTTLQIGNTILDTAITKSIMISNQGEGTLTIETSIITGDASFSIVKGEAPVTITNAVHNLEIQCLPEQTGNHTAVLTLTIANQKSVSYTLECVGTTRQTVIYSSTPKPNSTIEIGKTTVKKPIITTINIAEMGNETLKVISNSIDSSTKEVFTIIDGMAPFSIADGGDEHLLVVQCTPVEITEYTAQLTLKTNDPIRNLVKYDLTCVGIEEFSVAGEIRVKDGISGTDISIDSPEIFSLIGWIKPSPEHIGQLVDIIVNYHWKAFDNSSSLTIPVKVNSQVQLPRELEIILFKGSLLNMAGFFEVEFGYQTNDNRNFIGKIAELEIKPNLPPTAIELDIKINDDNKIIGTFNTIDSDNADQFTYSFINLNSYFQIIGNGLYITNLMPKFKDIKLVNDESFDNIYPIEVQTTDISGAYITEQFIIQIIPIINPPLINLTKQSVLENYQGIVGRIWTDGAEFKLLENEIFSLDDEGILRTRRPLDFETDSSHNITIQGIKEKIFTIDVINVPDIDVHGKIFNDITDFIKISANDLKAVTIQFIPDISHRNQEADILAVAAYTVDQQTRFLVRNNDTWQIWDRFTLPEFTHLMLEDEHEVALFNSGEFTAGELQVYIGYRLDNKELIYNPNPITIEINN